MKYAIRLTLGFIIVTQLTGCTIRILTFGVEESNTDREYMMGYKRDTITKEKDR